MNKNWLKTKMDLLERYENELTKICEKHNLLLHEEVLSKRRDKYIQRWRTECYAFLRHKWFQDTAIGKAFWKHRTAIIYSLKKHCPYRDKINNVN